MLGSKGPITNYKKESPFKNALVQLYGFTTSQKPSKSICSNLSHTIRVHVRERKNVFRNRSKPVKFVKTRIESAKRLRDCGCNLPWDPALVRACIPNYVLPSTDHGQHGHLWEHVSLKSFFVFVFVFVFLKSNGIVLFKKRRKKAHDFSRDALIKNRIAPTFLRVHLLP